MLTLRFSKKKNIKLFILAKVESERFQLRVIVFRVTLFFVKSFICITTTMVITNNSNIVIITPQSILCFDKCSVRSKCINSLRTQKCY